MVYAQFYRINSDGTYQEALGSDGVCHFDGRSSAFNRHAVALEVAYQRRARRYTHYRLMRGERYSTAQPVADTYFPCLKAWAFQD